MDILNNLIFGFGVALTPQNVLFCFLGAMIGTLIGVLPGIGPLATMAMLLPLTYTLPPISALIMLALYLKYSQSFRCAALISHLSNHVLPDANLAIITSSLMLKDISMKSALVML